MWQALTHPTWLKSWLADAVSLELSPSGEAWFGVGDEARIGWVEEVSVPVHDGGESGEGRLAFWWAAGDELATRVKLAIRPRDGGTLLRVVETRPLQVLDLVGILMPRTGGSTYGPALVAA